MPTDAFQVTPIAYDTGLAELRAVREPVFVAEQGVPLDLEWDDLDPACHHVIARDANNQPIGTGRLTPEHKIGRMAVLKAWRNKGVGDALMVALMNQARSLGWTEVSLNAQVSAEAFYARHGFQPYGERFMEAGIEHQAMRRTLEPLAPPERGPAAPRGPSVPTRSRPRCTMRPGGAASKSRSCAPVRAACSGWNRWSRWKHLPVAWPLAR